MNKSEVIVQGQERQVAEQAVESLRIPEMLLEPFHDLGFSGLGAEIEFLRSEIQKRRESMSGKEREDYLSALVKLYVGPGGP